LNLKNETILKKYLAAIICGFGAGVLQIVPFVKSFSCCMILPIAAFMSLLLDQRATKNFTKIPMKKAMLFGLFTGLSAALFGSFFELLITFITKHNDIITSFTDLQRIVNNLPLSEEIKKEVLNLFQSVRDDILKYGFSLLYTFSVIVNNFIVNSIFGSVGGLVGAQIINSRLNNQSVGK
jgi:hypothetical protein